MNSYGRTISIDADDRMASLNNNVWSLFDTQGWEGEPIPEDLEEGQPATEDEKLSTLRAMQTTLKSLAQHDPLAPDDLDAGNNPSSTTSPAGAIIRALESCDAVQIDNGPLLTSWDLDDEALTFSWVEDDEGSMTTIAIDAKGLAEAVESDVQSGSFHVKDVEGELFTISLYDLTPHVV